MEYPIEDYSFFSDTKRYLLLPQEPYPCGSEWCEQ